MKQIKTSSRQQHTLDGDKAWDTIPLPMGTVTLRLSLLLSSPVTHQHKSTLMGTWLLPHQGLYSPTPPKVVLLSLFLLPRGHTRTQQKKPHFPSSQGGNKHTILCTAWVWKQQAPRKELEGVKTVITVMFHKTEAPHNKLLEPTLSLTPPQWVHILTTQPSHEWLPTPFLLQVSVQALHWQWKRKERLPNFNYWKPLLILD